MSLLKHLLCQSSLTNYLNHNIVNYLNFKKMSNVISKVTKNGKLNLTTSSGRISKGEGRAIKSMQSKVITGGPFRLKS
jgi:hypothetical protein